MKRLFLRTTLIFMVLSLLLVALLGATMVYAQSGGGFNLSWSTIDGGGSTTTVGGGYSLMSTAGQPDAGPVMEGGGYTLTGGFWPAVVQPGSSGKSSIYYFPIIMKKG